VAARGEGAEVSAAEYEKIGRAITPALIEIKERLRGFTLFKGRF